MTLEGLMHSAGWEFWLVVGLLVLVIVCLFVWSICNLADAEDDADDWLADHLIEATRKGEKR
jgi:hypothetical protein